jgi:hypothetical protein
MVELIYIASLGAFVANLLEEIYSMKFILFEA